MKIKGSIGSYPEYFVSKNTDDRCIVITENEKRAKEFVHDVKSYLKHFQKNIPVLDFPESNDKLDIESQIKRNLCLTKILQNEKYIVVLSKNALNLKIRKPEDFKKSVLHLKKGDVLNFDYVVETLIKNGYIREEFIENQGEFSLKGGFLSVYVPEIGIIDLDLFGDTIENIFLRSKLLTRKEIDEITIFPLYDFTVKNKDVFQLEFEEKQPSNLKSYIQNQQIFYVDVMQDILKKEAVYFYSNGKNEDIEIPKNVDLTYFKEIKIPLKRELALKNEKTAFISTEETTIDLDVEPLKEGDYIIHEDYGIGIYRGIETREIRGENYDFMILEYAGGEKIYVSYLHLDKIFKYKAQGIVSIDKIGGTSWRNLKRKVKNSLKNVARELIKVYTERRSIKREPLNIDDELIYRFEKEFPFLETPDQMKAINDIKKDLSSEKPMERLVCGDVGFGKTEVALRAAFINVVNGKQVLVLTPTTVLSFQHYRNFKKRLEPYGIIVENLSRLKSKKQQTEILEKLEKGQIDIIVGTHKALQDDVKFKNLGLMVIDEEHRFGVRAKEKIKSLKKDIDILYLTATPIPRTLNMALSGLKDLSVINTPPEGRVETKTFVSFEDEKVVKEAVSFELKRKGQIFYLHNRVETIEEKAKHLKNLFPDVSVQFVHGKMKPSQIEKIILDFIEGKIDILVSTSIIETGIDIPTANTLIIERADLFGLAQLYHLRGRVGRGDIQAYCYLLIPKEITKDAEKRIDAIMRLTRPGSGLKVSIEDMQIRGPGNILGVQQSGHIKAVGFEMYVKLLKEAINEERGKEEKEPVLILDFESYIPEDFIKDPNERMNIYMAVSKTETIEEIYELQKYLKDFYQNFPQVFNSYLEISKLKKAMKNVNIQKIELKEPISAIYTEGLEPEKIMILVENLDVKQVFSDKIQFYFSSKNIGSFVNLICSLENVNLKK
jgi:transcription-repair coupling factor (superfamily II helicase)